MGLKDNGEFSESVSSHLRAGVGRTVPVDDLSGSVRRDPGLGCTVRDRSPMVSVTRFPERDTRRGRPPASDPLMLHPRRRCGRRTP